jgi:hypothetical protein
VNSILDTGLPVDPPVAFGSIQAYALCTVRNLRDDGDPRRLLDDQVFTMVVDGIDRATATRSESRLEAAE